MRSRRRITIGFSFFLFFWMFWKLFPLFSSFAPSLKAPQALFFFSPFLTTNLAQASRLVFLFIFLTISLFLFFFFFVVVLFAKGYSSDIVIKQSSAFVLFSILFTGVDSKYLSLFFFLKTLATFFVHSVPLYLHKKKNCRWLVSFFFFVQLGICAGRVLVVYSLPFCTRLKLQVFMGCWERNSFSLPFQLMYPVFFFFWSISTILRSCIFFFLKIVLCTVTRFFNFLFLK